MKNPAFLVLVILISSATLLSAQQIVPLWKNGAPGFEHRKDEEEQAKDWWAKNIHNPSITIYQPEEGKANGTAVLVCPGGGHRELVINPEGKDPALFLNKLGITAFVLKYRLAREDNSPYTLEEHVPQDVNRAMRLIRSRAEEWNINPKKLGIMGFSAGGEVAAMVAYQKEEKQPNSNDLIDKLSSKPDFQILIYPGPLGIPEKISPQAPPTFMLAANDDGCCSEPIIKLLKVYRDAQVPVEVHLYAQGQHGFNMGDRSKLTSINHWPDRLAEWLADSGYLDEK